MDKYEYKLKLDELRELFQLKNYKGAAELADEINWQKVRNSKTLCMVADVYEAVERYDKCQEVLMQAYDHSSVGRNIVSRLTDIAIKSKDIQSAEEYYNEFLELAPKDTQRYVFAYKIACLNNLPVTDRIAILEEFKEKEYSEMWAYELAVLYAQAGMRDKCVETCDELILWFGDGEYVERALDLKRSFQPLTPAQEEKYQKLRSERGIVEINIPTKAEDKEKEDEEGDTSEEESTVTATKFNTQNLQEEIAKSMQQIMDATEENTVRDRLNNIKKIVQDIPYLEGEEEASISKREQIQEEVNEELKSDFQEKLVKDTAYGYATVKSTDNNRYIEDTSGMSIEEILADWEKTKVVAQEAMAAAEQKKLDLEKEQALAEASAIMRRLEELVPILSATPGEDLPDSSEGTIADELLTAEPIITNPEEAEAAAIAEAEAAAEAEIAAGIKGDPKYDIFDQEPAGTLPEEEAVTRPLQEVISRATHRPERNPQDKMADVESLEDWDEENQESEEQAPAGEALQTEPQAAVEPEDLDEFYDDEEDEFYDDEDDSPQVQEEPEIPRQATGFEQTPVFKQTFNAGPADDGFEQTGTLDTDQITESLAGQSETFDQNKIEPAPAQTTAAPTGSAGLADDIKDLFSYFIPIPGMTEQISQVLADVVKIKGDAVTSSRGNVIVQGEEGSGKTILATDLIKASQKTMGREDDKIGKISAKALNSRGFAALVPKIAGGYLIVEQAGQLSADTVAEMAQVMDQNTGGMTVVLEDDSAGIRQVTRLNPAFTEKFTEKVKIPIFTIDELVDFGKSYALEQECEIEEMAVLALYNRLNNIQKLDHPTTLTEVKEIVDQAIENAEGGGIKKIFAKKYNDEDYLILHEEDFE